MTLRLAACLPFLLAVVACGEQDARTSGNSHDAPTWESMGMPWLELDAGSVLLHYGNASERLPAGGDQSSSPLALTMTSRSALVQTGPITGDAEVWMLTGSGDWSRLSDRAGTLVVADRDGALAAWTERSGDATTLVAYDTHTDRRLDATDAPGDAAVTVVEGDTVWFTSHETTWRWQPGNAPERLAPEESPQSYVLLSRSAQGAEARLFLESQGRLEVRGPDGGLVRRYDEAMSSGFSPDGRYLLVGDDSGPRVLDLTTGEETALTHHSGGEYDTVTAEFGNDGTVLVSVDRGGGDDADANVKFDTCQAPGWSCTDFHHPVHWAETSHFASDFLGQFGLAYARDGEACGDC